jgi:hypothetical protein
MFWGAIIYNLKGPCHVFCPETECYGTNTAALTKGGCDGQNYEKQISNHSMVPAGDITTAEDNWIHHETKADWSIRACHVMWYIGI